MILRLKKHSGNKTISSDFFCEKMSLFASGMDERRRPVAQDEAQSLAALRHERLGSRTILLFVMVALPVPA